MTFLTYLISGVSLGSVYAIIALGYTMVYGIAKMLNFAHGDIIMVGAYVFLLRDVLSEYCQRSFRSCYSRSAVCYAAWHSLSKRLAYKPLQKRSRLWRC